MKPIIFLGNEADAAGFRLAGVETRGVGEGAAAAFEAARAEAALLIVDAGVAASLPQARLRAARVESRPPLVVLHAPDAAEPDADPAAAVRRLLGLGP